MTSDDSGTFNNSGGGGAISMKNPTVRVAHLGTGFLAGCIPPKIPVGALGLVIAQ